MTSTELAIPQAGVLAEKIAHAEYLAKSELLPRQYRDNPANILLVMEYGEYLGIPAVAALRLIHVIDNRPVASAELLAGRVREHGHRLRVSYDQQAKTAVCSIWRRDDPHHEFRTEWSWDRASHVTDRNGQKLTDKANWRNYYPAMLKWRATTECIRDACPEVALGVSYTAEELGSQEFTDDEADDLGMMTRHQRVEHNELRRMGEPPAGAVEVTRKRDENDPWAEPPDADRLENFEKLAELRERWHFDDEDIAALASWLTPGWTGSRADIRVIATYLDDHLEAAGGDIEQASSAIWTQYREATGQDEETSDAS